LKTCNLNVLFLCIMPTNHSFTEKIQKLSILALNSGAVISTLLVLVQEQEMGAGMQAALFHLALWRFCEASCNHRYICMCSFLPPGRHLFTCTCLLGSPHPCKQASPLSTNQYSARCIVTLCKSIYIGIGESGDPKLRHRS